MNSALLIKGFLRVSNCGGSRGKEAQTMYTHVSKCKNDKIKGKKSVIRI
jgi:hypothetical protein